MSQFSAAEGLLHYYLVTIFGVVLALVEKVWPKVVDTTAFRFPWGDEERLLTRDALIRRASNRHFLTINPET